MYRTFNTIPYVPGQPILPTTKVPARPQQTVAITREEWIEIASLLAKRYIFKKTGIRDARLTTALLKGGPLDFSGWHWKFGKSSVLGKFPDSYAFNNWCTSDVQKAVQDFELGNIKLKRNKDNPSIKKTKNETKPKRKKTDHLRVSKRKVKTSMKLDREGRRLQAKSLTVGELKTLCEASAHLQFTQSGYAILKTESTGLHCGIFALCKSVEQQVSSVPPPKFQELLHIARTGTVAKRIQETMLVNDFQRNFTLDHLAAVLQEYGKVHNHKLRLGVCWEGRDPYIVPSEDGHDGCIVWIHNSNVEESQGYSHYSGMLSGPQLMDGEIESRFSSVEEVEIMEIEVQSNATRITDRRPHDISKKRKAGAEDDRQPNKKIYKNRESKRRTQDVKTARSKSPIIEGICENDDAILLPSIESDHDFLSPVAPKKAPGVASIAVNVAAGEQRASSRKGQHTKTNLLGTPFSKASFIPTSKTVYGAPKANFDLRPIQPRNYAISTAIVSTDSGLLSLPNQIKSREYEVSRILAEEHTLGRKHRFLVQWVVPGEPSWVDARDCHCQELIDEFRSVDVGYLGEGLVRARSAKESKLALNGHITGTKGTRHDGDEARESSCNIMNTAASRPRTPKFTLQSQSSDFVSSNLLYNRVGLNEVTFDQNSESSLGAHQYPLTVDDESRLSFQKRGSPQQSVTTHSESLTPDVPSRGEADDFSSERDTDDAEPESRLASKSSRERTETREERRQHNLLELEKSSKEVIDLRSPSPCVNEKQLTAVNLATGLKNCRCDKNIPCSTVRNQERRAMQKSSYYKQLTHREKCQAERAFMANWHRQHDRKKQQLQEAHNQRMEHRVCAQKKLSHTFKPAIPNTSTQGSGREIVLFSESYFPNASKNGPQDVFREEYPPTITLSKETSSTTSIPGQFLARKSSQNERAHLAISQNLALRNQMPPPAMPLLPRKDDNEKFRVRGEIEITRSPSKTSKHYRLNPYRTKAGGVVQERKQMISQNQEKGPKPNMVANGYRQNNDPGRQVRDYMDNSYRHRSATHESIMERKLNGQHSSTWQRRGR